MTNSFPEVAIVLAVFEPDTAHLDAQLASLVAQEGVTPCVIAVNADGRSEALIEDIASRSGLSVEIVTPEEPTSSFRSFEIGLGAALARFPSVTYFALCDQDDLWHPEKLARTIAPLIRADAMLVHCDAEVIASDGSLKAPSLHRLEKRLKSHGLRELLSENTVTGMTAVFTRDVVKAALPFPGQAALYFHHDLWLALVAQVLGGISRVDEPLVRYRQHGANVVGAGRSRTSGHRFLSVGWRRHWGGTYYVAAYLAKCLYLRMEDVAGREDTHLDLRRLRSLRPYLSERGCGFAHLLDAMKYLVRGRGDLARQSVMFTCVRLARLALTMRETVFKGFVPALIDFDQRAFAAAPGVQPARAVHHGSGAERAPVSAAAFCDPRRRLRLPVEIDPQCGAGVSVMVPSLNPSEIFAGVATAIDLGLGLAERGHAVTFIATDSPIANLSASQSFLAARRGGGTSCPAPHLVCTHASQHLTISPDETLVATAWWTAHICDELVRLQGRPDARFYYLVQDFEPGFYPWNEDYAGALESYVQNSVPIFNSMPLRDYFRDMGLMSPMREDLVFHPAIDIGRYAGLSRRGGPRKKIAFYGRPEVPRNLFSLGVEALDLFLGGCDAEPGSLDIVSVGLAHDDILFATGHRMRSLGKIPWAEYPEFLSGVDLGLSLMLSPHPSHPPLEMAAAGARVVTNGFAGKNLSTLTTAIQSTEPSAKALSDALTRAWTAGPAKHSERAFDLSPLGDPLETVIDRLSDEIRNTSAPLRMSA